MTRVLRALVIFGAAALRVCFGQGAVPADSSSLEDQKLEIVKYDAELRASAWHTLALDLEPRLVKMLPCDARVGAAIDEVKTASDARFAAARRYWQAMGSTPPASAPAQDWAAVFSDDQADAGRERDSVAAHLVALKNSVGKAPSLNGAVRKLEALAEETQEMTDRAAERLALSTSSSVDSDPALTPSEMAQKVTASAAEQAAWTEYYAARSARAQTECAIITNPQAAAPRLRAPQRAKPVGGATTGETQ